MLIGKYTVAMYHDCKFRILMCPLHMNPIVPEISLLLKKRFVLYLSKCTRHIVASKKAQVLVDEKIVPLKYHQFKMK